MHSHSLRLICLAVFLFMGFGALADTTPIFSDNPSPIFENTYLIDNIGNNSLGADLTLRINKKAPFEDCKNKTDCPASVIVSNATGNVNMPVDVNVRSLFVGKNQVIDSNGKWVGPLDGLKGDKGDSCSIVGPDIVCGSTKIPLATFKGDKGSTGDNGSSCYVVPNTTRVKCGNDPEIDLSLSSCNMVPGTTRIKCGDGSEADLKGDTGETGEPGQTCTMVPGTTKIQCGDETPVDIKGPTGNKGQTGWGSLSCTERNALSPLTTGANRVINQASPDCNFIAPGSHAVGGGCEMVGSPEPKMIRSSHGTGETWMCSAITSSNTASQGIRASVICCNLSK